jgi:hypothetical protein
MRVYPPILALPVLACLSFPAAQAAEPCPVSKRTRACEFPIAGKPKATCPAGKLSWVCPNEAIEAELSCYSSSNAVICDGYPLEVETSGQLQYTWQVRVSGATSIYYGASIYVPCQATNPVSVRLSVQNGSYVGSAFTGMRCGDDTP